MKDLKYYEEVLEYERGKLHQIIKAMAKPINNNKELLEQGRKVDGILNKIQKLKDKGKK